MVAAAIAVSKGPVLGEAREHIEVVFEARERLQRRRQHSQSTLRSGSPVLHVDAVGHEEKRHAERSLAHLLAGLGEGNRLQMGQCQRNACAPQKCPSCHFCIVHN